MCFFPGRICAGSVSSTELSFRFARQPGRYGDADVATITHRKKIRAPWPSPPLKMSWMLIDDTEVRLIRSVISW